MANPNWQKGMKSPNPSGRKPRQVEEKYLKKLQTVVKLKDWVEIILKAIEQAKEGDEKARRWISDYMLGKPAQSLDITSDGEPLSNQSVNLNELSNDDLNRLAEILRNGQAADISGG